MTKSQLSDEERILRAKRRFSEALITGLLFGLASAALTSLYEWADQAGFFLRLGLSHAETENAFFSVLAVVLVAFAIFTVARYWTPRAERQPAFLRKDMDNIHQRWRWLTLILGAAAVLNTSNFISKPQDQSLFSGGVIVFILFSLALVVCFGPGFLSKAYRETLNDELMRTQRAKAARLGYLLALLGVAGLYFVQRDRPEIAGPAAMAILCAICVIPAFYFVVLDWRSDATDKE